MLWKQTRTRSVVWLRRNERTFLRSSHGTPSRARCKWEITVRSFRINKVDPRRATFLNLASQIGSQLREAYARRHEASQETQSGIARKLGIGRSAVNRRLTGQVNMTIETLADMVWALGYAIKVTIFDPVQNARNQCVPSNVGDGSNVVLMARPQSPSSPATSNPLNIPQAA